MNAITTSSIKQGPLEFERTEGIFVWAMRAELGAVKFNFMPTTYYDNDPEALKREVNYALRLLLVMCLEAHENNVVVRTGAQLYRHLEHSINLQKGNDSVQDLDVE